MQCHKIQNVTSGENSHVPKTVTTLPKLDMAVNTCNPSTQEAAAGGFSVQVDLQLTIQLRWTLTFLSSLPEDWDDR